MKIIDFLIYSPDNQVVRKERMMVTILEIITEDKERHLAPGEYEDERRETAEVAHTMDLPARKQPLVFQRKG